MLAGKDKNVSRTVDEEQNIFHGSFPFRIGVHRPAGPHESRAEIRVVSGVHLFAQPVVHDQNRKNKNAFESAVVFRQAD